jgi:hypothetical protein
VLHRLLAPDDVTPRDNTHLSVLKKGVRVDHIGTEHFKPDEELSNSKHCKNQNVYILNNFQTHFHFFKLAPRKTDCSPGSDRQLAL